MGGEGLVMSEVGSDGFPDRGPAVFAVVTATLALASVFVVARLVCRTCMVGHKAADDYMIGLAWILALALGLSVNTATYMGLGRHDVDIAPHKEATLRKIEYTFSILYNPALMATKTSILIFYLGLSRKSTQKVLRVCSWAVLVVVNVAGTILTTMNIFQCRPVESAWDVRVRPDKCLPLLTEFICSAPINIVTDLAILALPIPVLTGMRLPPRQKTILVLTFALGIFVTVTDVVRIYYLQKAITLVATSSSDNPAAIFGETAEFSWNASLSLMWSTVEVNVGIMCACVPTLKPLIIKILPAMLVDPKGRRRSSVQTQNSSLLGRRRQTSKQGSLDGTPTPPTTTIVSDSNKNTTNNASPIPLPLPLPPPPPPGSPLQPRPVVQSKRDPNESISFMDFLASSDADADADRARGTALARNYNGIGNAYAHRSSWSYATAPSITSAPQQGIYFGFVNMRKPKSMLKISTAESWRYCTVVALLFLIWGFSYGMLNTLNGVVARVSGISIAQTLGLTSMYFGCGYFLGPLLVGTWMLGHDEHRRCRWTGGGGGGAGGGGAAGAVSGAGSAPAATDPDPVGGFKTTFIVGLLIYGSGTIIFWPSAVLGAWGGFMVSSFVVGFGLAVLETAANPFLALCGRPEYTDMRLLLAQGVQAVGSVLSGLLADKVFFVPRHAGAGAGGDFNSSTALLDVQWTYLAITLLCYLLSVLFYYMPLPEVRDSELAGLLATETSVDARKRSLGGISLRTWNTILAVAAQWLYVGAQECMSIFFYPLVTALVPEAIGTKPQGFAMSVSSYRVLSHAAFAISRFACGYLAYLAVRHPRHRFVPTPRTLLTISMVLSATFALVAVVLRRAHADLDADETRPHTAAMAKAMMTQASPDLMAVPVVLFFLAEGPIWPLTFSLGLRGQGERTKRAAAWLTMGASGPAFWPFVVYAITRRGGSIQTGFVVVVVLLVCGLVYPLFLTFCTDARTLVDPSGGGREPAVQSAMADEEQK